MTKSISERLRYESDRQCVARGDYLTYGTPDPWLREAADYIDTLERRLATLEAENAWLKTGVSGHAESN